MQIWTPPDHMQFHIQNTPRHSTAQHARRPPLSWLSERRDMSKGFSRRGTVGSKRPSSRRFDLLNKPSDFDRLPNIVTSNKNTNYKNSNVAASTTVLRNRRVTFLNRNSSNLKSQRIDLFCTLRVASTPLLRNGTNSVVFRVSAW